MTQRDDVLHRETNVARNQTAHKIWKESFWFYGKKGTSIATTTHTHTIWEVEAANKFLENNKIKKLRRELDPRHGVILCCCVPSSGQTHCASNGLEDG